MSAEEALGLGGSEIASTTRLTLVGDGDDTTTAVASSSRSSVSPTKSSVSTKGQNESEDLLCLICDVKLGPIRPPSPSKSPAASSATASSNLINITQEDAIKYRAFLAETYQFEFAEAPEDTDPLSTAGEKTQAEILKEFPICNKCFDETQKLFEEKQQLDKITKSFSSLRDNFAKKILGTYVKHTSQVQEDKAEKQRPKSKATKAIETSNNEAKLTTAFQRWKHVYTGEFDKQMTLNQLLQEKEQETIEREHRRNKEMPNRNISTAKYMTHMQKTMAACYFAPKLALKRKQTRICFSTSIPEKKNEKHVCTVCSKVFQRLDTLNIHARRHASSIKAFKCTEANCTNTFSSLNKLRKHKATHTTLEEDPKLKCHVCSKVFRTKSAIRSHMKRTHNLGFHEHGGGYEQKHSVSGNNSSDTLQDLFGCSQCSKVFLKSSELTEHLKIHEEPNVFGCDFCGKAFTSRVTLKEHLAVHFGINPYICDECGNRFATEALLVSHLKTHKKEFICSACNKVCRSRDGLRKHELTHAGDKPYNCSICGVGFTERKTLDAHMIKHTGKFPFTCSICKDIEGFRDAKDLRKHRLEVHPELVPNGNSNVCEFCWNSFNEFEALQDHIAKVHERYKCHVCSRVFKLGDHLRRHMYIHTGEKPFKCKLCDKTFNQESNLKEHMYRHTGIRPHQCPHCPGIGYLRRVQLKEHMLKEHGTDEVPSLPMGRAAQNARKSGLHPVPEPLAELLTSQALMSSGTSNYGNETILPLIPEDLKIIPNQIPVQGQIVYQSDGTPVFIRKVNLQTAQQRGGISNTQKITPIIMRNVPNTSAGNIIFEQQVQQPRQQSMVLKRPIPIRNVTKRPATFEETTKIIPVHRIKKDPGGFETIETSDPDQQQIIIYTV